MIIHNIENIVHVTKDELKKTFPADPSKYVFWCGAGVSAEAPTNLPLGNAFAKFVLSELIDGTFSDEIGNKLVNLDGLLRKIDIEMNNSLRLESVISEVSLIENNMKPGYSNELDFIQSLSSFNECSINIYHMLLAKLVTHGSNVVTTNYDFGIEKALDIICPGEYSLKKLKEGQYIYCSSNPLKGKIYHIHGTANNPKELGITYQTVSRPFHQELMQELNSWMEKEYYFAFLGYSCGDNYDVERYFEDIYETSSSLKAHAIYVQRKAKDIPNSVKRHLNCFSKAYVFTNGINVFLQNSFECLKDAKCPDDSSVYDWKELVSKQIHVSPDIRGLLFFRICKMAGLNPKGFGFYHSARESLDRLLSMDFSHIEDYAVRLTQFHVLKEEGDIEACIKLINDGKDDYNRKYNSTYFYPDRTQYDMNEILAIKHDFDLLKKCLPSVDKIENGILKYKTENKSFGWEFSTPLHQHAMIIIHEVKRQVLHAGQFDLSAEILNSATELLYCNDRILDSNYGILEEINQYCVALRVKAQILTILSGEKKIKDITTCINRYLDLYIKESSILGILISLFEYSNILYLLYIQSAKYDYLMQSKNLMETVKDMQKIINNERMNKNIKSEEEWRSEYEAKAGVR